MSDKVDLRIPSDLTAQPFLCPDCRSKNCSGFAFVDPAWTFGIGEPSKSPWEFVFQLCFCADCGATLPAHLAERWEGRTVEEAVREWEEKYRDHPYDANIAGSVTRAGPRFLTVVVTINADPVVVRVNLLRVRFGSREIGL